MAGFSDFLENNIIDFFLRNDAAGFTPAAAVYVALFTGDPSDTGDFTDEVVAGANSYARQAVTFTAPASGASGNAAEVRFDDMPAGTVTHFAVVDSPTFQTGNVLYHGALTENETPSAGDNLVFPPATLTVSND